MAVMKVDDDDIDVGRTDALALPGPGDWDLASLQLSPSLAPVSSCMFCTPAALSAFDLSAPIIPLFRSAVKSKMSCPGPWSTCFPSNPSARSRLQR